MRGRFLINGETWELEFRPEATLLEVLRENGFTEVKQGCDDGLCGACAVLLDGKPVPSCQVLAATAQEVPIVTAKGIGTVTRPHPLQKALADAGAVQCGFCTPGIVVSAYALLQRHPYPTEAEIRHALDGHLCRCTGYVKILEGVRLAAERMQSHEENL